jgi:hypothetical protein
MDSDECDLQTSEKHVFHSLGCSHPLARLMPFDSQAPAHMQKLQKHVWDTCDAHLAYEDRVSAALSIRKAIDQFDLCEQEAARLAIDILQGLHQLLFSAAVLEHLASAHLAREEIEFEDRAFASPPGHPLPVLVKFDLAAKKRVPVTRPVELGGALNVWTSVSLELLGKPYGALEQMRALDLRPSLRMLILFLIYTDLDQFRANVDGKLDRFRHMGLSLWETLLTRLRHSPEYKPEDEAHYGTQIQQAMWHRLRSKSLDHDVATGATQPTGAGPMLLPSTGTHVVIRGEIPIGATDEDRQSLGRYERLRQPMPVARLPAIERIDALEVQLNLEFPWATSAIAAVVDELRSRRLFGGVEVGLTPTLFVGPPGSGKSRLARRIAEELKSPHLTISLAGMGDSRAILGTARGWSGGQASPILNLMLNQGSASALIALDELDKTSSDTRNDGPPTSALLGLLEPENARTWYDTYLQAACDMTKLMFVATANALSPIPKPLLSRMRVVLVPEPKRRDFPAIAQGVLSDIAREWGLPDETFANLGRAMPTGAARSAREIRAFVLAYLNDWAKTSLGPSRVH